jgi:hypothetical protein
LSELFPFLCTEVCQDVSPSSGFIASRFVCLTGQLAELVRDRAATVTGTVTGYSLYPDLPAALTLNTATGTISGTPTTATATASYTLTADNAAGSATANVQITLPNSAAAVSGSNLVLYNGSQVEVVSIPVN